MPKIRISSIGALYQGQTCHGTSIRDFELFTHEAAYLCGHNIFAQDLPYLEKAGIGTTFLNKEFIDTLYLSPLFFPNRPNHRLVKDYQLLGDHLNNPVTDSQLAKEVLEESVEAWQLLPLDLLDIYSGLLGTEQYFEAFFKLFPNILYCGPSRLI
ncbi:PolC-type DNA polymerase III domain-containing protein [Adhaeribacter radiodurans]|uniref:Uncharacterized protein n=1 Tax=Adhaeribacter radiodurans TaxID=2745197 RepID=A0A7L7L5U1_9BACT|nr:hypothetical protein [Adhaeribacter radiodurans]QMU28178.1 hypothetical protein HUW48_09050 [Adhaeribacter radiodurans]